MRERNLEGIGVSPGIVIGVVRVYARRRLMVRPRPLSEKQVEAELKRFDRAIERAAKDIARVSQQVQKRLGAESAGIFEAHLLMLEDPMLVDRSRELIREEQINADFAVLTAMSEIQKAFGAVKDEFFRQRLSDLEDVGRRLIDYVQSRRNRQRKLASEGKHILVADDLSPSEAACLDTSHVAGLITEKGSKTSHTAILCRSVGVPAVVGVSKALDLFKDGDACILDGISGRLIVDPDSRTMVAYSRQRAAYKHFEQELETLRDEPPVTTDGHEIELSSNIELPLELEHVQSCGGTGIGLYRTEYLFLARNTMPSEELQYTEYIKAAQAVKPGRVIIRTFDLGGDKQPRGMVFPPEANPFLGWRAIRVSLDRPKLFRTQLRAILRASVEGNVQVMFPMISGLTQLEEALKVVEDVKAELRRENVPFNEQIPCGIMVEVPSAVIVARELARRVDFFSIGTNDLTQYLLAVDRNNATVAHLFQSMHPAVLRSMRQAIQAAREEGIWVGMCGELAGDPAATMLLLGMGLDELSVSPVILPEIKMLIRALSLEEAREFTNQVLTLCSADKIQNLCDRTVRERFGSLPIWRPQVTRRRRR